jgi:hypothetical protein
MLRVWPVYTQSMGIDDPPPSFSTGANWNMSPEAVARLTVIPVVIPESLVTVTSGTRNPVA